MSEVQQGNMKEVIAQEVCEEEEEVLEQNNPPAASTTEKKKRKEKTEQQFILRLPPEAAAILRQKLRQDQQHKSKNKGKDQKQQQQQQAPVHVSFLDNREGNLQIVGVEKELHFNIADLPCVVETYKTNDGGTSLFKSADIGQMFIAENPSNSNSQQQQQSQPLFDEEFRLMSGLTPPTKNVRKSFRKPRDRSKIRQIEDDLLRAIGLDNRNRGGNDGGNDDGTTMILEELEEYEGQEIQFEKPEDALHIPIDQQQKQQEQEQQEIAAVQNASTTNANANVDGELGKEPEMKRQKKTQVSNAPNPKRAVIAPAIIPSQLQTNSTSTNIQMPLHQQQFTPQNSNAVSSVIPTPSNANAEMRTQVLATELQAQKLLTKIDG